ncbi:MarR family transcriptional regulator [Acetobacterium bakii]|uniref:MarR family transcriptional regulator n=2 Tax=Acetobacterium bakii TaxID=52689 RepID=A0A0L6TXE2_9FIRM|nr:MarR family transcriptional regulator [Acetobacterium bakii]
MEIMDSMIDDKFIFGSVLIVSNQMDTLLGRELQEHDLTTKQWLLIIVIENSFDHDPSIKEVAKAMGSSHQNVKQVALKLEKKGFLLLEKDKNDARVLRIKLTDRINVFAKESQLKAENFTRKLFKNISKEEMTATRSLLEKMLFNLAEMEKEIN